MPDDAPRVQRHLSDQLLGLAIDPWPWLSAFSLTAGKAAVRNLAYSMSVAFKADDITVATVTIACRIPADTPFAPARIADALWRLYLEGASAGPEVRFKGCWSSARRFRRGWE